MQYRYPRHVPKEGSQSLADLRPIDKLGKKTKKAPPGGFGVFTLKFPTEKLLEMFGLPTPESFDDPSAWNFPWRRDEDLVDTIYLDVTKNDEGRLIDRRGKVLDEETVDEIKAAITDANRSGTLYAIQKRIFSALERILETFSNYRYEYEFLTDEGRSLASGVAQGIISVDIKPDITTIVAQDDIIHIIQYNIAGIGMFYVTEDFEGEPPQQFAKTRFGWLKDHWEIHGERRPEVDLDNVEDFDKQYFVYLLREIEKAHGLKLVTESATRIFAGRGRKR